MNRWRERIKQMESDPQKYQEILEKSRLQTSKKQQDYLPRYRQSIDKSQVENTKRLLECGINYKEISKTLGITMSNVMKIKKAILTNKIDEIVDDTAEKIKESVLMRKSGLIESEEEEIKPKVRRNKRKIQIRSEKIELRKKRPKIQVESEESSESENYSEVSDNDWDPQDSCKNSNDEFDDENFKEIYETESESNDKFGPEIKQENFNENYEKNIKIEKVSEVIQNSDDPLIEPEIIITDIAKSSIEPPPFENLSSPKKIHKKPQQKMQVKKFYPRDTLGNKPLNDRDAILAKKLLDNGIRRVDIAVMLETTEKAVSKLLDRAQGLDVENVDDEINESVENFIKNKEKYKGVQKHYGEKGILIYDEKKRKKKEKVEKVKDEISDEDQMEVKRQTAMKLLLVNVKVRNYSKKKKLFLKNKIL